MEILRYVSASGCKDANSVFWWFAHFWTYYFQGVVVENILYQLLDIDVFNYFKVKH